MTTGEPTRSAGRSHGATLSPERERELLDAHRRGDGDAMAALLRGYQHRIYGICSRMVRNADEAADLTQDSLVRIMQGLASYDGRSALSTWVVRVTMNTCLSHLRKQKLRRHGSLDDVDQAGQSLASRLEEGREPSSPSRVEQSERDGILLAALGSLEPETRAILVLRDLQGLDYEQIAAVMETALGTVKSRLFRARAALRRAVEERGPSES